MKQVMISDFKAHLSAYVAAVRGGETVIICDRSTPVAKLEPLLAPGEDNWIQEPRVPEAERVEILRNIKPARLLKNVDVHAILDDLRADAR